MKGSTRCYSISYAGVVQLQKADENEQHAILGVRVHALLRLTRSEGWPLQSPALCMELYCAYLDQPFRLGTAHDRNVT